MYHQHRLETPPPSSQFRRPWSPDPNDPFPSIRGRHELSAADYDAWAPGRQRREPSDVSVEALDLADYAMTLNRPNFGHDYRTHSPFRAYDAYPPSPQALRPFASQDSLQPPSLTSATTGSSSTHHPQPRSPMRRPFSLPVPSRSSHSVDVDHTRSPLGRMDSPTPYTPGDEIDISQFPAWSRNWYHSHNKSKETQIRQSSPPPAISPFDPAFPTHTYHSFSDRIADTDYIPSSVSHESTRNLLPWSNAYDPPEYESPLNPETKEERMRMLEQEFGPKSASKDGDKAEEKMIGGVDEKGNLVTEGPKKRAAMRWLETLLALGTAVSGIYGAAFIKPSPPAPPAGKPPAYVLYVVSVLTFLLLTYTFLIHPCCSGGRGKSKSSLGPGGPFGAMVLPVQQLPGGSKAPKKKKGKKGGYGGPGDVQVNLIVDPNMFVPGGLGGRTGDEEDEDEEWGSGKQRRAPKRRGVFEGLAMEEQWKSARKHVKKLLALDIACAVLWLGVFVYVLIGQRCPSGGYDGWCNTYNVATAAACLLALAFCISVFFDIKDLHASRQSPRTRT